MLELDLSDYERKARELGSAIDQVPFALARAMTTAAFKVRDLIIADTWPIHVHARNRSFMRAALRVVPASKYNLEVHLHDVLGRAQLQRHAKGGVRTPKRGGRLAIPPKGSVTRGAHGITPSQLARYIVDNTPRRALRVTPFGIFVGQGGRLHLKYCFVSQAQQPQDVPFYQDFNRFMSQELQSGFPQALASAMATRR